MNNKASSAELGALIVLPFATIMGATGFFAAIHEGRELPFGLGILALLCGPSALILGRRLLPQTSRFERACLMCALVGSIVLALVSAGRLADALLPVAGGFACLLVGLLLIVTAGLRRELAEPREE